MKPTEGDKADSGTVSYKGLKLQSGILKFVGPEGAYSAATIQSDATFIITDIVPGEVKVGIMESPHRSGLSSTPDQKKSSEPPVTLPEKYRDPQTSGLKCTNALARSLPRRG